MTRPRRALPALVLATLAAWSPPAPGTDDAAQSRRVVSLAPNLTELVFAAGAGTSLVGVSAWSDHPPAARELPVIGDAFTVDQERLALLQPDLLLVWQSGTPAHVVDKLRDTGYTVEVLETRRLADIASALRRIGRLTGHEMQAEVAAARFLGELQLLREAHAGGAPIRVFYQVSSRPLYTVNGEHYISELIDLCGGRNVFAGLDELAPTVAVEAVVERDPEVMLATDAAGENAFGVWQRWPAIAANRYGNHFLMPADEIGRATPRLLVAGKALCGALRAARSNRAAASPSP